MLFQLELTFPEGWKCDSIFVPSEVSEFAASTVWSSVVYLATDVKTAALRLSDYRIKFNLSLIEVKSFFYVNNFNGLDKEILRPNVQK